VIDIGAVPRETRDRFDIYLAELRRWQATINLVGPGTLDDAWSRHVLDSLQLGSLAQGQVWVDLGSGAGLPGLILAIADLTATSIWSRATAENAPSCGKRPG
jgi:16S rRNA (guanine527-N7)-methyltransferase